MTTEPTLSYESDLERRILAGLRPVLPASAASYQQAYLDLRATSRTSYRGTAVELRETLREVLDHFAPDTSVVGEAGFETEKDRRGPTMRQKMAYVLRARSVAPSSRKAPTEAAAIVDELTAAFVRSTYEQGSAAAHGTPSRQDLERLKTYVDAALRELVETA